MATMNNKNKGRHSSENYTINHEGERVYRLSALESLFSKVLGSFFGESTFYENRTAESDFIEMVKLINSVSYEDIEYVLKIALLGRNHNMISYPLAVLTACFNDERFKGSNFVDENGDNKLKKYSNQIIRRGKDIVDIMSMQISAYGFDSIRSHRDIPLPIQLRKCLRHKLESFDEYQLSKALCSGREVSMADCIKLLHPREYVANVRKGFYQEVIEGRVKFGDDSKQIQSELSKVNNSNTKTDVRDVLDSIKTSSVMAVVKNLVALVRSGYLDREHTDIICSILTDKNKVRASKLLPFRFYSAWKELESYRGVFCKDIQNALVKALDYSVDNVPKLKGYNAILIDLSGSMSYPVSRKSSLSALQVAAILGAICYKQGTGEVYVFANDCRRVTGISKYSTVMDIAQNILSYNVGGGTYLDKALQLISADSVSGAKYDKLILLSDNDCYRSYSGSFSVSNEALIDTMLRQRVINRFYINNLLGNNFAVVSTKDYRKNLITGFSDKFVDTINMYEHLGGSSDIRQVIDELLESRQ